MDNCSLQRVTDINMVKTNNTDPGSNKRLFIITIVLAAIAVVAVVALLVNIFERKQESRNPYVRVVELNDQIDDPEVWGKQFPMEYDSYERTTDMQRTRYGGSEGVPHSPTQSDPRT